ncbi:cupin [Rhodothermaceae bacterium RA]|nr:cupin [Rhodothermaceae bacterium RA]
MSVLPSSPLGALTVEQFLAEYWQKKPLLIRGALPGFTSPLSPQDLAGLACEEEVISRLVLERGGDYPWQLHYGPFSPEDFEALPETHWSLLVQEVDRYVPEVAALLEHFRFVPNWRIDDVMISYAPKHGGVGPHVDNYDVFLLQGLGHRRWQIHHTPVEEEHLVPDLDVRILADFEPDAEWVLAPGDLLYLPPRIPHNGIAEDDCMTYSIGFRAPSTVELLEGFLSHVIEHANPGRRYADPDLRPPAEPGAISPEALARIRSMITEVFQDEQTIDRWFGRFMTEPKRGFQPGPDDVWDPAELADALREGATLHRYAIAQLAFIRHADGSATLFAGGAEHRLSADLAFAAPLITGTEPLDVRTLAPHLDHEDVLDLLTTLVNDGALRVSQPA